MILWALIIIDVTFALNETINIYIGKTMPVIKKCFVKNSIGAF